jgi:hypothetical protein
VSAWVVADAVAVVARAEALMGVSMAAAAASRVAEPALLTRALEPALSWRQALIAGAHRRRRSVDGPASAASAWWRPALAVTLVALAVGASAALSGDGVAVVLLLGSGVVGIAAAVVLRLGRLRSVWSATGAARRVPHLIALGIGAEAVVLISVMIAVVSAASAAPAAARIPLEAAAVVVAARLLPVLGAPPSVGIALGAGVLVVLVARTGMPVDVGLAGLGLWWSGWLIGGAALLLLTRRPMPQPESESALGRDGGRWAHRAAFTVLGLAPTPARDVLRRRIFDSLFAASADPWDYTATYERRKQQHLVASLRGRYATIVEVGCADGHNLAALARACPQATVLGTDVSTRALDVARLRTSDVPNIRVVTSDDAVSALAVAAQPQCVVLAEVLYYLVTARAMRDALSALVGAAGEPRDVLMLHGAVDGRALHRRAARALGLEVVHEDEVEDPVRPFILTLARTRSDGG